MHMALFVAQVKNVFILFYIIMDNYCFNDDFSLCPLFVEICDFMYDC